MNSGLHTSRIRLVVVMVTIALIIVTNFIDEIITDTQIKFEVLSVYGIIVFMWICISWWLIEKNIINMYMFFMFFSILFYWGQPIAFLLGANVSSLKIYSILIYSYTILNKTLMYVLISYMLIHIGGVLLCGKKRTVKIEDLTSHDNTKIMNLVGLILLFLSIVPTIILIGNSIITVAYSGYIGLFTSATNTIAVNNGIVGIMSGFFIPSLYLLLITNANKKKKFCFYSIIFFVYIIVIFMLGRRGENSIFLLGYILIWHNLIKPIKGKNVLQFFLLGILFVFALSVISQIRAYLNTENIWILMKQAISGESLLDQFRGIFAEFGITLLVPATIIEKVPVVLDFYSGKSYINFFLVMLPNIFWETNPGLVDGTLESIVSPFIRNGSVGGLGGSFLAEAFYNFGYLSYVLYPLFGVFLSKLTRILDFKDFKSNKLKFFLVLYVFTNVIWIIRSEVMISGKEILYFAVFPVLLIKLIETCMLKKKV